VFAALETADRDQSDLSGGDHSAVFQTRQPIHAALYEGSALYMPTALPGISIQQASLLMQEQDRIIRSFPEVESVFAPWPFRQRH